MEKKQSKNKATKESVLSYLESKGWDFKTETNNHKIKNCIFCANNSSNLEVQVERGYFHCWACGEKGSFYDLKKHTGDLAYTVTKVEEDTTPPPTNEEFDALTNKAKKYSERIWGRESALNYIKNRGFNDETIKHFAFGAQSKHGQYWLTIPHFESGIAVNIKYRSIPPEAKKWRQEAKTKKILFNIDAVSKFAHESIILTEGELKTAALWQMGFKNSVSLTGGVDNFPPEWVDILAPVKKIYLCLDSDKPGVDGAEKLGMRLGLERCYFVELPDAKDPDEYFFEKNHTADEFKDLLKRAKKQDVRNIVSVNQALKKLQTRLEIQDTETVDGLQTPWANVNNLLGGLKPGDLIVLGAPPKVGKCHGAGTPVIMFTGKIKAVEEVKAGEYLLGPDSKPRLVESVCSGKDEMFKITPKNGEAFTCNEAHVLSLKVIKDKGREWKKGSIKNISLYDYLRLPTAVKEVLALWRTPITFRHNYTKTKAYEVGATAKSKIPFTHLINSKPRRLECVAGVIDSHGDLASDGSVYLTRQNAYLERDIKFLIRSLGINCDVLKTGDSAVLRVSGDLSGIPSKLFELKNKSKENPLHSMFEVTPIGKGKYYGFTLSDDHLYLLADFTVTHNTTWALDIALYQASFGNPVLFMCLEMNAERLAKKIACNVGNMAVEDLDVDRVALVRHKLRNRPLYLVDQIQRGSTTEDLFESMRASYRRYGLKMIVFDNIHFAVRSSDNLREKLGELSQSFKLIAEELKIPIIVIVHPRKIPNGKQMTASDFRETGAIHADADQVIILHRDPIKGVETKANDGDMNRQALEENDGENEEEKEALLSPLTWIIVDSSRDVQGGRTKLYYDGAKSQYRRIQESDLR